MESETESSRSMVALLCTFAAFIWILKIGVVVLIYAAIHTPFEIIVVSLLVFLLFKSDERDEAKTPDQDPELVRAERFARAIELAGEVIICVFAFYKLAVAIAPNF
jgi:hypothetical protein